MQAIFAIPDGFDAGDVATAYTAAIAAPAPAVSTFGEPGAMTANVSAALTAPQVAALVAALTTFTFAGVRVRSAADVNRVTTARVRAALGLRANDADGEMAALSKWTRKGAHGQISQADKTLMDALESLRQEGRDYKSARGWT